MRAVFFTLFSLVNSFVLQNPVNIYKREYDSKYIKVYEPENIAKKDMSTIVFYTGANSLIPGDIYSNFIRALNNFNFTVNIMPNDDSISQDLLYSLRDEYKNIIPLTHSSGYVNAIKNLNNHRNIKKAVFLDPVDNSDLLNNNLLNLFNRNTKKLDHLENVLVLNAEKSYKWKLFPKFEIPFIPGFALDIDKLEKENKDLVIEKIDSENYGHSDVLDSLWSDLMHATMSKGYDDRSQKALDEYHLWIAEMIYNFVNKEELMEIHENTVSSEELETDIIDQKLLGEETGHFD